jgi:hypothetical protein
MGPCHLHLLMHPQSARGRVCGVPLPDRD